MELRNAETQLAMCVNNEGYEASLELQKIYRVIPDSTAAKHDYIRVIDESGEGYLYPEHYFVRVLTLQGPGSGQLADLASNEVNNWDPSWNAAAYRSAHFLGSHLFNEPLDWLSNRQYKTVYEPFRRALLHYWEAKEDPSLLDDVVVDMYQSVQALSEVITGREATDLTSNVDALVSVIHCQELHKQIIEGYVSYADQLHEALKQKSDRHALSIPEVEAFIYSTSLFIRLALQPH
jgi:hypothetical protein